MRHRKRNGMHNKSYYQFHHFNDSTLLSNTISNRLYNIIYIYVLSQFCTTKIKIQ